MSFVHQINLQTIGQLSLPAGTFAVTAKAGYKMMGAAGTSTEVGFQCRLRDSSEGPRDFATVGGWLGAPNSVSQGGFDGTVSLAGDVANSAPAKEIVECGDTTGASGIDFTIDNLVIQAVQIDERDQHAVVVPAGPSAAAPLADEAVFWSLA